MLTSHATLTSKNCEWCSPTALCDTRRSGTQYRRHGPARAIACPSCAINTAQHTLLHTEPMQHTLLHTEPMQYGTRWVPCMYISCPMQRRGNAWDVQGCPSPESQPGVSALVPHMQTTLNTSVPAGRMRNNQGIRSTIHTQKRETRYTAMHPRQLRYFHACEWVLTNYQHSPCCPPQTVITKFRAGPRGPSPHGAIAMVKAI